MGKNLPSGVSGWRHGVPLQRRRARSEVGFEDRQCQRLEEPSEEEGSEANLPNSERQRSVSADEPAREPEVLEKAMESELTVCGEARWRPYHAGNAVATLDDEDDYSPEMDLWVYDEARGVLLRQHNLERAIKFTPTSTGGCPAPVKWLSSEKRVVKKMGRWQCSGEGPRRWWTGWTEFKLRKNPSRHNMSFMVKKSWRRRFRLKSGKLGEWLTALNGVKLNPLALKQKLRGS